MAISLMRPLALVVCLLAAAGCSDVDAPQDEHRTEQEPEGGMAGTSGDGANQDSKGEGDTDDDDGASDGSEAGSGGASGDPQEPEPEPCVVWSGCDHGGPTSYFTDSACSSNEVGFTSPSHPGSPGEVFCIAGAIETDTGQIVTGVVRAFELVETIFVEALWFQSGSTDCLQHFKEVVEQGQVWRMVALPVCQ